MALAWPPRWPFAGPSLAPRWREAAPRRPSTRLRSAGWQGLEGPRPMRPRRAARAHASELVIRLRVGKVMASSSGTEPCTLGSGPTRAPGGLAYLGRPWARSRAPSRARSGLTPPPPMGRLDPSVLGPCGVRATARTGLPRPVPKRWARGARLLPHPLALRRVHGHDDPGGHHHVGKQQPTPSASAGASARGPRLRSGEDTTAAAPAVPARLDAPRARERHDEGSPDNKAGDAVQIDHGECSK